MRGLLGDRFLRRFAGDLKHWRKHQNSIGEGQNPEAEVVAVPGPGALWPETVGLNSDASEEDCEEAVADTAGADTAGTDTAGTDAAGTDTHDVPIKAEPNKPSEIGPKAD